jgi:hypothetical protein
MLQRTVGVLLQRTVICIPGFLSCIPLYEDCKPQPPHITHHHHTVHIDPHVCSLVCFGSTMLPKGVGEGGTRTHPAICVVTCALNGVLAAAVECTYRV